MHPQLYFKELVEPAVAEFEQEPTNIRRAYAACLFLYHFAEAVDVYNRSKDGTKKSRIEDIREDLAKRALDFRDVEGIATMVKHIEVKRKLVRPKLSDTHVSSDVITWTNNDGEEVAWKNEKGDEVIWYDFLTVKSKDQNGRSINLLSSAQNTLKAIADYLVSTEEVK